MKNFGIVLMLSIWFVTGCSEPAPLSGRINFTDRAVWQDHVYLLDPLRFAGIGNSYLGSVIDSASIDESGTFRFTRLPDSSDPMLLQLCIQKREESYLNALENENIPQSNYFPLIWQNGSSIKISTSAESFQKNLNMENPDPQNGAMLILRDIRQNAFEKYLARRIKSDHDDADLLENEKALHNFQKELMQFANETAYFLPALTAIRWVSPEANYERIPEFIFGQCKKWKEAFSDHPMAIQLCQQANRESLPLMIGDTIPDFLLPMLSQDTISLKQLLGSRLTVLDLWASWCIPCRHENQDYLVPLWKQFHESGLQIIGYALDASFGVWNNAIQKDGADRWPQASHLQGDEAPLFAALRIVTIPANFILDADGKVIAKNLHGEELTQFVEMYLSVPP